MLIKNISFFKNVSYSISVWLEKKKEEKVKLNIPKRYKAPEIFSQLPYCKLRRSNFSE